MKQNKTISVVISAYNEEKKIEECLESVKWVDEIIFVDNSSSDKTSELAKKYTSNVYKRDNNPMLNSNKNFGFSRATSEWILSLDADERITEELKTEIKDVIKSNSEANGYWIPRKNIIFGKWVKSEMWWPDYQLRLFRNGKGKFPAQHVHEYIEVEGRTEQLKEPMIHLNYATVSQFLQKMNTYTDNEAEQMKKKGKKMYWHDAIGFPANDFLKTYFLQKGYKNGLHGLVLSLLQALYMEIVFVKLWEQEGFKDEIEMSHAQVFEELNRTGNAFKYWILTTKIAELSNPLQKVFYKLIRKNIKRKI